MISVNGISCIQMDVACLINSKALNSSMFLQIYMVIAMTPIGVASLLASTILKSCNLLELVKALALYVSTVIVGLGLHSCVVIPTVVFLLSRQNPLKVFRYTNASKVIL